MPTIDVTEETVQTPGAERFEALSEKNDQRNFRLGVGNGVLYVLGTYFISRATVIPSFFSHLTHSSALIGIVSQFESIGWYLPQFFTATYVVHYTRKLPIYRMATWLRGTMFFGMALVTLLVPNPAWLLVGVMALYAIFTAGSGISGIVFLDLVAKTIPPTRRGRFFALRASYGALLSATVGAAVISYVLSRFLFPTNFGLVFAIGATIATSGLTLMAIMREPRSASVPEARTLRDQIRTGREILRTDRRYLAYLRARLLMATWSISIPFIVLFANSHLGFETGDLGLFIAADCIGVVIGSFFWERLTDRRSSKVCLEWVTILSAVMPLTVIAYLLLPLPRMLFPAVFAIASAVDSGTGIGGLTYLIEIAPERERSTYIGLFHTLMALPSFLAALAGALLDFAGFGALYGIVLTLSLLGLIAVSKLEHISKSGEVLTHA